MKSAGNLFTLKLSKIPPVTVDLPATGGTPVKIDITQEMVASVTIQIDGDSYWTVAEDDATGAANLGSDATRFKMDAGILQVDVSGCHDYYLYIKSQAAAVTDGISYAFSEFA